MTNTVASRPDRIQYSHLIMIVLVFCVGWVGAVFITRTAQAAGVVGDGTPGSCTEAALDTALVGGGVVAFNCGSAPLTITVTSEKVIAANTTLDGGSLIILSGGGTTRLFNVNAGVTFDLANMTIRDGNANGAQGGGLLNNGATTITVVSFVNNTAEAGGGIVNNSTLIVANSFFSGNAAHPTIYEGGSGIQNNASGHLAVSQSIFFGNNSDSTGGAIHNFGSAIVTDSTFTANSTGLFGGGITNYGTLILTGSTFTGNSAGINGGAIDTIVALTVTTSSFINNFAGYRGGAINNYIGTVSISHSTFSGNTANAYGGGLTNDAGIAFVTHSTFTGNAAQDLGGGIANDGWLDVQNSTLSDNDVGGAYHESGGGLSTRDTSGGNNGAVIVNSTFVGNTASNVGGNLYNENSSIILLNTLIANASPANCAGVITSQGHNLDSNNSCGFAAISDLININPVLGPLQNNGGATLTHAPLLGSPAIDTGDNANCPATDQRDQPRPVDGGSGQAQCDIGAYEADSGWLPTSTPPPAAPPRPMPFATPVGGQGVGSSGGIFQCGKWIVTIPVGAAPDGSTLHCGAFDPNVAPPTSPGFKLLRQTINVNIYDPNGSWITTFNTSLTFCYPYTADEVRAAGGQADNFVIQTAPVGGAWNELTTSLDTALTQACASVNHLTLFEISARVPSALPQTGGTEPDDQQSEIWGWALTALFLLMGGGLIWAWVHRRVK